MSTFVTSKITNILSVKRFHSKLKIHSYCPDMKGCVPNIPDHIRLMDQSLHNSSGIGLFRRLNDILSEENCMVNIKSAEALDQNERFSVLSHGTQNDPIFNYANAAALTLFEQTIENLCITPSRYSTVPELMEDRSQLLRQFEAMDYGYIYDAIRTTTQGKLFSIKKVLVWNLYHDNGDHIGLAAFYDTNCINPYNKRN
eukprot:374049_1